MFNVPENQISPPCGLAHVTLYRSVDVYFSLRYLVPAEPSNERLLSWCLRSSAAILVPVVRFVRDIDFTLFYHTESWPL